MKRIFLKVLIVSAILFLCSKVVFAVDIIKDLWIFNRIGNYIYTPGSIKVSSTQYCLSGNCITSWPTGENYWSDDGTNLTPATSTRGLVVSGTSTFTTTTASSLIIDNLTGILKAVSGLVQVATAGVDYFNSASQITHNLLSGLQGGGGSNYYHSDQPINTTSSVVFAGVSSTNSTSTNSFSNLLTAITGFFTNLTVSGYTSTTNIYLPKTRSSTSGIIFKNNLPFIHDYSSSTNTGKNLFIGGNSGNFTMGSASSIDASNNIGLGNSSLKSLTIGRNNTAIGNNALLNNTSGGNNISIGNDSMYSNINSSDNIAIGLSSLRNGTSSLSRYNIGIGYQTLYNTVSGQYNLAVGYNSLLNNTTGDFNTGLGYYSLLNNTTGLRNVAIGPNSLDANTEGDGNIGVGYNSLSGNTTGDSNISIGYSALGIITTASNNIAIGNKSMSNAVAPGTENTAIGTDTLKVNRGDYNIALGSSALSSNTTGDNNISLGYNSLASNATGTSNISLGYYSLNKNTGGNSNIGIGTQSLYYNKIGNYNVGLGGLSLFYNTDGEYNTALGYQSLYKNTGGDDNTAIGYQSLYDNTTGNFNLAIGPTSLTNNVSGDSNIAFGVQTMNDNISGSSNSAIGKYGLYKNTTGNNNIAIGESSLYNNLTGSNNTAIGTDAGRYDTGSGTLVTTTNSVYIGYGSKGIDNNDNAIVIGYNALGMGSNTAVLGNNSITDTYLKGSIHEATTTISGSTASLQIGEGITPAGNYIVLSPSSPGGALGTSLAFLNGNFPFLNQISDTKISMYSNSEEEFRITANSSTNAVSFTLADSYSFDSNLNVNGNVTSTSWHVGSGSEYLEASVKSLGIYGNGYFLTGRSISGSQPGVGVNDSLSIIDNGLVSAGISFIKSDLSVSKSIVADLTNSTLELNSFNTTTVSTLDAGTIYADNFKPSYLEVLNNLQVNENITGFGLTGLGGYADTGYRLAIYSNNGGSLRIASTTSEILHIAGDGIFDWNPYSSEYLDFRIRAKDDPNVFKVDASNSTIGIGTSTPWAKLAVTNETGFPSFIVEDTNSPDTTPFIIDYSGNVGIGTSTPGSLLDVNGNTKIRGQLDVENGIIGNGTYSSPTPLNPGVSGIYCDDGDVMIGINPDLTALCRDLTY